MRRANDMCLISENPLKLGVKPPAPSGRQRISQAQARLATAGSRSQKRYFQAPRIIDALPSVEQTLAAITATYGFSIQYNKLSAGLSQRVFRPARRQCQTSKRHRARSHSQASANRARRRERAERYLTKNEHSALHHDMGRAAEAYVGHFALRALRRPVGSPLGGRPGPRHCRDP